MTFKEKLKMEHPDKIDPMCGGGCFGCPSNYDYEERGEGLCKGSTSTSLICEACWNREIPGRWDPIRWPKKNPHLTEKAKAKINANIHLDPRDVDVLDQLMGKSSLGYIQQDLSNAYDLQKFIYKMSLNSIYGAPKVYIPDIKKVIFNDPATIVIWADGEKTVVKCQNGEPFDPEKGLAMAITKRALGNKGNYFDEIKKWTKEYDVKCAYPEIVEIHMNEIESAKIEELVQGMVRRRELGRDEV